MLICQGSCKRRYCSVYGNMDGTVSKSLPVLTVCIFNKVIIFTRVLPRSLGHSFLWLTQNNELVNYKQIWLGTCWGIWHRQVWATDCISILQLVLCVTFVASVPEVWFSKMVRALKVYFYLLAESVSGIIKVLSSLFETPKGKESTRTDLGIERKWDKEGNHHTSEWCSDWSVH